MIEVIFSILLGTVLATVPLVLKLRRQNEKMTIEKCAAIEEALQNMCEKSELKSLKNKYELEISVIRGEMDVLISQGKDEIVNLTEKYETQIRQFHLQITDVNQSMNKQSTTMMESGSALSGDIKHLHQVLSTFDRWDKNMVLLMTHNQAMRK